MGPALQDFGGLCCVLAAAQAAPAVEVRTLTRVPVACSGSDHRALQAHMLVQR